MSSFILSAASASCTKDHLAGVGVAGPVASMPASPASPSSCRPVPIESNVPVVIIIIIVGRLFLFRGLLQHQPIITVPSSKAQASADAARIFFISQDLIPYPSRFLSVADPHDPVPEGRAGRVSKTICSFTTAHTITSHAPTRVDAVSPWVKPATQHEKEGADLDVAEAAPPGPPHGRRTCQPIQADAQDDPTVDQISHEFEIHTTVEEEIVFSPPRQRINPETSDTPSRTRATTEGHVDQVRA